MRTSSEARGNEGIGETDRSSPPGRGVEPRESDDELAEQLEKELAERRLELERLFAP